ncbi:MAG TPA: hypothetical protein VK335_00705 [Bryobacteraceae bacterium]|nr:hypothetical protein [Bryobacteraceae bacterium]HZW92022.1 hypothetical protein [Candidatus Eremiobacteraceae bacterium]
MIDPNGMFIDYLRQSPDGTVRGIRFWNGRCQFVANAHGESVAQRELSGPVYLPPLTPSEAEQVMQDECVLLTGCHEVGDLLAGKLKLRDIVTG